ncbi:hypothetical protein DFH09DRAFT_1302178 [Mycena vulgaris]|nr:hypothetical protein DFH09DRAFT_1302178 [Mycena vulgaris]
MHFYNVQDVLGLSHSVLRPFIEVHQLLVLPFPVGDSPVDFLVDPDRSALLWNEQDSAEEMVVRWIVFAKGDGLLHGYFLALLDRCGPNPKILLGLESLNLSALHPKHLLHIVNWLRRLLDPPMNVIRVWEEQILSIKLCYNALRRDFGRVIGNEDFDGDSDEDSAEDSSNGVYEEGQQA